MFKKNNFCLLSIASLFIFVAASAQAAPPTSTFDCGSLNGTKVREGEYFFPQDCTNGAHKYCRCDLSSDEPPLNENCREVIVKTSSSRAVSTRDYSCSCQRTSQGWGIRCTIIILPSASQHENLDLQKVFGLDLIRKY